MTSSVKELVQAAKEADDALGTNSVRDTPAYQDHARARLRAAIAAVIADGDGWIDVKQELPREYITVLAYTAGTSMFTMRLGLSGWMINGEDYGGLVTHWQPLHSPPRSEPL